DRIPHDLVVLGRYFGAEPVRHPRIRRIARVPFSELVGLYHGCDLFVYPTRYEGFGLPLIEAMAAGARCVASTAGAVMEVGGDAATYFDPCDEEAMARAILDALNEPPKQRRRYVEAGRQRARDVGGVALGRRTRAAVHLGGEARRRRGAACVFRASPSCEDRGPQTLAAHDGSRRVLPPVWGAHVGPNLGDVRETFL